MRTYCGVHCDLLVSLGSETGILVGIHSCSSLNITMPRSLCSTELMTGIGRRVWPGVIATGQGRSGVGLGVGVGCPSAGRACDIITTIAAKSQRQTGPKRGSSLAD